MAYYFSIGGIIVLGVLLSAIFVLYVSPLALSLVLLTLIWAFVGATVEFLYRLSTIDQ
jgi:hypothetical protein